MIDPDPFSIHGYRSIFHPWIQIHFPSMDPGSGSIFHPWIEDPDLFSIHESRIRIHFSSMDSGSGSTFKWYDIDYINNAILKDLKLFVFFFLRHFTRFFVKKINLLCLYDSFDQFWRHFYFILLFWELWGVTKRQCFFSLNANVNSDSVSVRCWALLHKTFHLSFLFGTKTTSKPRIFLCPI